MRRRHLIILLFCVLVFAGTLAVRVGFRDTPGQGSGSPPGEPTASSGALEREGSPIQGQRSARKVAPELPAWEPTPEEARAEAETVAEFFGKLVDQHGNPIPGVPVKYMSPLQDSMKPIWETRTDAHGGFHFIKERAPSLAVHISPPAGYEGISGENSKNFWFAEVPASMPPEWRAQRVEPHRADPENPVIFRLRKMGRLEPLVHRNTFFRPKNTYARDFPVDADEEHVLRLELKVHPETLVIDPASGWGRHDWSIVVFAPGGGVRERVPGSDLEAPVEGYRESIRIAYTADMRQEDFRSGVSGRQEYYARFADGTYARFSFRVSLASRPTQEEYGLREPRYSGRVESYYNPSGSTATAYDTALEIKVN